MRGFLTRQYDSIYNTWEVEYYLGAYGWSDKQIDDWKIAYRVELLLPFAETPILKPLPLTLSKGYSWIGPVVIIGLLWLGNVGSHFAREHRKGDAIRHLLAKDKASNSYDWRKPELPRKDTSLSTTSTLVNEPFENDAPPSKPLPPLPPPGRFHRRSRSASDAQRISIAFDPDMPYVPEELSQITSSPSYLTRKPVRTKTDTTLQNLNIKRDTSPLQVIPRGTLRTVTAVWQAFTRTWLTWRRFELFGVHCDLNEIVWTLAYFAAMILMGFLQTPSIDQFTKTNVTIHRVSPSELM